MATLYGLIAATIVVAIFALALVVGARRGVDNG
jgi:hypothetical protein